MTLVASAAPFAVLECPRLRLRMPQISLPGAMTCFMLVFGTYFMVTSGVVYDMINMPPSVGVEYDPATGAQRPAAILKNRINGQYIIEGFSGGFLYCMGGLAFILLDIASQGSKSASTRLWISGAAGALLIIAFNVCLVFFRMKLPGYLM